MTALLVTGTGTGVGKTVVTAALAALALDRGARCTVVKPAQTGVPDDAPGDLADVERLAGRGLRTVELVRYPDPLSPAAAARLSGRPPLDLAACVELVLRLDAVRDLVLVEGAGGLLVRMTDDATLADVAALLAAPVLVVAAAGLGTLNATELTVEALRRRGLACPGVVVGAWPAAPDLAARCNLCDLPATSGVPLLGAVPEGAGGLDAAEYATVARHSLAPSLGGGWQTPEP